MPVRRVVDAPFGVNIIGFISGNLGLGVATRNTVRLLRDLRVPVALTDVDPGGDRFGHDREFESLGAAADPTPYVLTVFHMNPPEIAFNLQSHPAWIRADRASACVPFWELPVLPRSWVGVLEAMDIILAPTAFIRDAVHAALPDATCIHYRQMACIPDDITPDRIRWGLPDDVVAFVTSFDITSDFSRKNPEGTLAAFRQAFPDRTDVRLVLKVNATEQMRVLFADRLATLAAEAASDPRIVVIDEVLSYREVLSLYASCNVLVSLHRSEGLGLSLMEAMLLGRPVIATGWSGNMDFMTAENSCLVGFDLVGVDSRHPSYAADIIGPDVMWAEPHVHEAAAFMTRLADDTTLRHALGERARADLEAARERYESGELVEALRAELEPHTRVWSTHADRRRRLRRLARVSLYSRARRAAGRAARAVGLKR